jgi:uncharacterized protein YprB with RNaseH-like and TPR domain
MQLDTQDFLRLVEKSKTLCCWDTESTGLRGDYNSILCLSVKPFHDKPTTFSIVQPGNDQKVVKEAKAMLESMDCWVTYYGKGFDIKMLNTRLLKWGLDPVEKRPHVDLYFTLKSHLLTGRRSQAHLLEWLETPEKKMSVGADMWNDVLRNPQKAIKTMIERCESDCQGLENLYDKTRHLINDVKR